MRNPPNGSPFRVRWSAAACLLLAACAPDLRQDFPFDGALPDGASRVTFEGQADGATLTRVDATHKEAWVHLDLDAPREVPAPEAVGASDWDLAFQRFKIIANGGVSGVGQVAVAVLPEADFDALSRAPDAEYLRDAPDGSDANTDVDSAFLLGDGWYNYDLLAHKVTPRANVYVVDTGQGFYKLELLGYYDHAGTAAKLSFRWGRVEPPTRVTSSPLTAPGRR